MDIINNYFPNLETERLILRPMLESDARLVINWRNSERIATMTRQSFKQELTQEDHLKWFAISRSLRIDYIIVEKETNNPIGSVSFKWMALSDCHKCGELGKYIGETSALGKGFAFEFTKRWIEFGFDELGLDCIIAITRASNAPNIRVNQKLGFKSEPFPSELEPMPSGWLFMRLNNCYLGK